MKPYFSLLKFAAFGMLSLFLTTQCSKTYEPYVTIKVVNQKDPSQTIADAKVSFQDQLELTDKDGLAILEVDLDRFILDRVEVRVSAKDQGYQDTTSSVLVGKDHQESVIIPLRPFNKLKYIPDSVVILANETFKEVKIINEGLDFIPIDFVNTISWIGLNSSDSVVAPDKPSFFKVIANPVQQNCRIDGEIKVNWIDRGSTRTDRIPVTKFLKDDEPPFPNFTVKQNGSIVTNKVYVNKPVSFDANPSTDNCESFGALKYSWDFGDNNPTGFQEDHVTFQYTFSSLGNKTIKFEVRDAAGNTATKTLNVTVELEPSPPIIDPNISVLEGNELLSVQLNARIINFGNNYESLVDYGFVYSTVTDMPTLSTGIQPAIRFGSIGPLPLALQQFVFDTLITGLQPRRYYFRAFAQNNGFPPVYSETFTYDVVLARFEPIGGAAGGLTLSQRGDKNSPYTNQKPQATITYSNFLMTNTEITNAQYVAFLNDGPTPPNIAEGYLALNINDPACKIRWNGNAYQVVNNEGNKPVVTVTYEGAKAFCTFLGGRLPTEAEWEAAARANASGVYPQWSGTVIAPPVTHVVYNTTSPSQVGLKSPNGFGLFDMSGNVAEWCQDWYDNYSLQNIINPQGPPSSPSGERVIRGGSYSDSPEACTVSFRGRLSPISRSPRVGFRVVKDY